MFKNWQIFATFSLVLLGSHQSPLAAAAMDVDGDDMEIEEPVDEAAILHWKNQALAEEAAVGIVNADQPAADASAQELVSYWKKRYQHAQRGPVLLPIAKRHHLE